MFKHKRYLLALAGLVAGFMLTVPFVQAAEPSSTDQPSSSSKAPVTQAYGTDATVQTGMIVRLNPNDSSKVEPLKHADSKDMFGVVVSANQAALTLSGDREDRQVFVATYGQHDVLVSTQNGPVQTGDYISISAIDGVGMRADGETKTIIGKALNGFDGKANVQGTSTLTSADGKKAEVSLGRVKVQVLVQPNPLQSVPLPSVLTNFLSRIGYSVSNKTVNPARLYLALLVLLFASFVAGALLFSAVRSTMTAIGRNPLARRAIYRSLVQVVIAALIVFVVGIFAAYLLIKL